MPSFTTIFNTPPTNTPPQPATTPASTPDSEKTGRDYAERALASELEILASTPEGSRNHQLNISSMKLFQLVAGGMLDETRVHDALSETARRIGLDEGEIEPTIRSGARKGVSEPRTVPARLDARVGTFRLSEGIQDGLRDLWEARPVLQHIRDYAHTRYTAPSAVLACCIARTLATIPPRITLPPIIGGRASLNFLCALVGPSGAGKGAAQATAEDCLTFCHKPDIDCNLTTLPLGSGEGITHAYKRRATQQERDRANTDPTLVLEDGRVWAHKQLVFDVKEIDSVAAISQRRGSTLMSQLRSAYSGEPLGFYYADDSRRNILPSHSYRLCLIAGVQPEKSGAILDDADGGTPQRFLWASVIDPHLPAPQAGDPIVMPPWVVADSDVEFLRTGGVIHVPEQAVVEVRQAHWKRATGTGDALDGHALQTRLKVMVALAYWQQRLQHPTVDDWKIAGQIMNLISDPARQYCLDTLAEMKRVEAIRRADLQAVAEQRKAEKRAELADELREKVREKILRILRERGECTRREMRDRLSRAQREAFDEVLGELIADGAIAESIEKGKEKQSRASHLLFLVRG